jgi:hypothetical protein
MKNGIALAALLSTGLVTSQAEAAGPYDGVYQYGLSPVYYSIHQNGNQLLAVTLGILPTNGTVEVTVGSYSIAPTSLGNWDYATGVINGGVARVTGIGLYGACVSTSDVAFSNGVATVTFVSAVNTPFGTTQGVNCAKLISDSAASLGGSITLRKIF